MAVNALSDHHRCSGDSFNCPLRVMTQFTFSSAPSRTNSHQSIRVNSFHSFHITQTVLKKSFTNLRHQREVTTSAQCSEQLRGLKGLFRVLTNWSLCYVTRRVQSYLFIFFTEPGWKCEVAKGLWCGLVPHFEIATLCQKHSAPCYSFLACEAPKGPLLMSLLRMQPFFLSNCTGLWLFFCVCS